MPEKRELRIIINGPDACDLYTAEWLEMMLNRGLHEGHRIKNGGVKVYDLTPGETM